MPAFQCDASGTCCNPAADPSLELSLQAGAPALGLSTDRRMVCVMVPLESSESAPAMEAMAGRVGDTSAGVGGQKGGHCY